MKFDKLRSWLPNRLSTFAIAGIAAASLAWATPASAAPIHDYDFEQGRMVVDHGEIYIISSFDSNDALTVYNFNGQRLWEVRFHAKIIAWDIQPNLVIVFSKDRGGHSTYLTCLNRVTGQILWEHP